MTSEQLDEHDDDFRIPMIGVTTPSRGQDWLAILCVLMVVWWCGCALYGAFEFWRWLAHRAILWMAA